MYKKEKMENHKRKRYIEESVSENMENNILLLQIQEELMKCKIEQREIKRRETYTNEKINQILELLHTIIENKEKKIEELERNMEDLKVENEYFKNEEEIRRNQKERKNKEEDSTFMYS
jgi:hypothetical protein